MIVELALIVIKRGIRALRISVQNPAHPLSYYSADSHTMVTMVTWYVFVWVTSGLVDFNTEFLIVQASSLS